MFYGVAITFGLQDWQILQRTNAQATVRIGGRWRLEPGAVRAGVRSATPVYRLVSELDQRPLFPWTPCDHQTGADNLTSGDVAGEWDASVTLPQGGPYRLETSLDAVSRATGEHWMFRGDIRVHLGVGDVFCMAGQSNAAGYAKGFAYDPPDLRVHLLRNSGRWDLAAHPMNDATDAADCLNAPMSVTGTSPFLSFGRRYADLAGVPVGLIQAAQGGSPMKRWDLAREGDLYRNMMRKLGSGVPVRAILWYQGCADADPENAALYADGFTRMVSDLRRQAGWQVPVFTMQLNRYETQLDLVSWAAIKEIQRQLANQLPQVWLMPTAGLPQSDEIHTSASGNVSLGERLAMQVHGALNGGPAFEAPAPVDARMLDGRVCLSVRCAGPLSSLRVRHDLLDFILTDSRGVVPLGAMSIDGGSVISLTPSRPVEGRCFLSYGCTPSGPEGLIVDQVTWLPIIPFDHLEVES